MTRRLLELAVCGLAAAILLGCGEPKHLPGKPYHHTESGFRNPPGSPARNSWLTRAPWVAWRVATFIIGTEAPEKPDYVLSRDQVRS